MRCDSHVHVVGPADHIRSRRPGLIWPSRRRSTSCATPPRLGRIERFVIVQPSFYGADNTVLLESLDALGGRGRGVAVVDPATIAKGRSRIAPLAAFAVFASISTAREGMDPPGMAATFSAMADLAAAMSWHVEVIAPIEVLAEERHCWRRPRAGRHRSLRRIRRQSRRRAPRAGGAARPAAAFPHVWMKLSAPYRVSDDPLETRPTPSGSPPFWSLPGALRLGQRLAAHARTRYPEGRRDRDRAPADILRKAGR